MLAGPILVHLNYHWLFWIPMIMSAIATVATYLFVSESPVGRRAASTGSGRPSCRPGW